jgi:tRNA dimethylallyltransferase
LDLFIEQKYNFFPYHLFHNIAGTYFLMNYNLITILGPTASGKTSLAAHLAAKLHSSVISADSRQIYRGMDIGTGKDIVDYTVNGQLIPYFLVDICEAGVKYNVYEFQKDFTTIFNELKQNNQLPVMCGGSGMYIESVLKSYKMTAVPVNEELRQQLEIKTDEDLIAALTNLKSLHNTTDINTRKRLIRAIEIETFQKDNPFDDYDFPEINSLIVGVLFDREIQKQRITERLKQRLQSGMIDEVRLLLEKGISADDLIYYGLEYKFITLYLTGKLKYDEMFQLLNIAIHQFSKRQMTWFRKMEREGFNIHWIDGHLTLDEKVAAVTKLLP